MAGASDIIAEMISDNAEIRKILREFLMNSAQIVTTLKPGEKYLIYQTYENYKEPVAKIPSHRILAINRGEKDECLKVDVEVNQEKCLEIISNEVLIKDGKFVEFLNNTIFFCLFLAIDCFANNSLIDYFEKNKEQLLKNKNVFFKLDYYNIFLKMQLQENVVIF